MQYQRVFSFVLSLSLLLLPQLSKSAELEEIIERGRLKVAVKGDLRPLAFYNTNNQLDGLEIEIAQKIAEKLLGNKDSIEFIVVRNEDRLKVVLEDKVDLAIAQITFTTSRARLVNFSPFYYLDGTGIISNNPLVESLSDLQQSTIVVLEGSSAIAQIRAELPQARLIGVKSYKEALIALETGKAVALAADNTVLAGWVQEYPQYTQLPLRLGVYPLGVVMPKGLQYQSLYLKIQEIMQDLEESGWLEQRARAWGLPFVKKD
jgi:polar amino acid transport system substrate-binding protein